MILDFSPARSQILKGWHDMCQTNDTPSGLVILQTRIHNHSTCFDKLNTPPSELFGYGLKREDAFQNTHLGRIGNPRKVVP